MKNKYNIALRPCTLNQQVIELAQQFAPIAHQYLLGESSLPHLTLCHFFAEKADISAIWQATCQALAPGKMTLQFAEFSHASFKPDIHWISLIPTPDQYDTLKKMHLIVADIIKDPINRAYDRYDPHMTLINTKNAVAAEQLVKATERHFTPLTDEFVLSLGLCDESGQYIQNVSL